MRDRVLSLVVFLTLLMMCSSPAIAQVFYPSGTGGVRSPDAKKAEEESKRTLTYDPHDVSGIWRPRGGLMGGVPAPPMTPWAQEQIKANQRTTPNPCDPQGYPRSLSGGGYVEFVQTPGKILQIFQVGNGLGFGLREIYTDGRKLPEDLDPRWYGWAVGHWEGDALVVESQGYDERAWLDRNGHPHSEDMKLHEVFRHPDAMTLEITMTIEDPKAYTKPWVGAKQTLELELPKGLTVRYESYCVPSEMENYNEGIGGKGISSAPEPRQ